MWAHFEQLGQCERKCVGMIRVFEDEVEFGDPYRYAFPFRMLDPWTIELIGIVGRAPTISEVRCMEAECRRRGITKCVFRRASGAKPGEREYE